MPIISDTLDVKRIDDSKLLLDRHTQEEISLIEAKKIYDNLEAALKSSMEQLDDLANQMALREKFLRNSIADYKSKMESLKQFAEKVPSPVEPKTYELEGEVVEDNIREVKVEAPGVAS